ncbi:MAG: Do family serine endopeptidase [Coprobacter sp.]|nr:Do family serine endopeptidase [Coprobacter sp.]
MKDYGKKLFSFALVALVSSGVSVGAFAFLNSSQFNKNNKDIEHTSEFARPAGYMLTSHAAAIETDFTKAAESTVNAVVSIKSTTHAKQQQSMMQDPFFEFFFGQRGGSIQPQPRVGMGSGVIISTDGYIVTNNHVIEGADILEVTLNDKRAFNAKVIGTDPSTDLALLKIEATDLPIIPFGDSDKLQVGEWVLAVGNPFQLTSTVTAGIVSAKARSLGIISNNSRTGTMGLESFIQTDAAVNPGNSGGALVNTNGELVGINTAIYSETGAYSGYSFAIPTSIVSKVITDLKQYGTVQRAVLGIAIRDINSELAKEKDIEVQDGAYVEEVNDRSAAMEAGIKKGDIIKAINGVNVKNVAGLQEQVNRYRPGDKIKVTVVQGKQSKELTVTLKNIQGNTSVSKAVGIDSLGAAFKELKEKTRQELNIRNGVQVDGIKAGKFQEAGIRNGFIILRINNSLVTSVSDVEDIFNSIMKSNSSDKVMFITGLYPNGKTGYYAVDLSE